VSDEKKGSSLPKHLWQFGKPEEPIEDVKRGENQRKNKKEESPVERKPDFVKEHKEYQKNSKNHQVRGEAGIKSILPKSPLVVFCHGKKIGQSKMEDPGYPCISIKALVKHYFSSLPIVTAMCLILLMTSGIFAPLFIVYMGVTIGLLLYATRFRRQQIFRESTHDDLHRRKIAMLSASSFPLALIVSLISINDFMPEAREPWIISLSIICIGSCIAEDVFATIDALHATLAKGSDEQ
jgi:hypothetical protein